MARNRANDYAEFSNILESARLDTTYCIFISHKQEDSEAAKKIADYIIERAGVDVYLDQNDYGLQHAVRWGNDEQIVRYIERGLNKSTHLLCLISDKTKESWWVPYEVGYAKSSQKDILSLKLKNVTDIPSFLKIEKVLSGTRSLNSYLENIRNPYNYLISYSESKHPLDNYLNWKE